MKVKTKFNKIKKWIIESENTEYSTPIFTLFKRNSKSAIQDRRGSFYIVDAPDWINVIALTPDNEIVLVRQYRHGIHEITWEIPGGAVDLGDSDPLLAAKRELEEETGFTSDDWVKLGKVSANPAIFTNYCHFYIARNCTFTSRQNLDDFEEIVVKTETISEFLQQVREGKIHHSLVIAAVAQLVLQNPELVQ
jgi:8-oxo-dGTP pyrophosphatase MutT (NUDIX family)